MSRTACFSEVYHGHWCVTINLLRVNSQVRNSATLVIQWGWLKLNTMIICNVRSPFVITSRKVDFISHLSYSQRFTVKTLRGKRRQRAGNCALVNKGQGSVVQIQKKKKEECEMIGQRKRKLGKESMEKLEIKKNLELAQLRQEKEHTKKATRRNEIQSPGETLLRSMANAG